MAIKPVARYGINGNIQTRQEIPGCKFAVGDIVYKVKGSSYIKSRGEITSGKLSQITGKPVYEVQWPDEMLRYEDESDLVLQTYF